MFRSCLIVAGVLRRNEFLKKETKEKKEREKRKRKKEEEKENSAYDNDNDCAPSSSLYLELATMQ